MDNSWRFLLLYRKEYNITILPLWLVENGPTNQRDMARIYSKYLIVLVYCSMNNAPVCFLS